MVHANTDYVRHSSWGRTRGPKNLNGANTTPLAAPTGDNPATATDGYATENQRFLHVSLKNAAADNLTVQVWAYSHAFGTWGILTDVRGTAATVTANDSTVHKVIEISGVDRVYFKKTGASVFGNDDALFAAASTF